MNQPWLISALQEFFILLQGPRDMTLILNFRRIINALNILFEITLFWIPQNITLIYDRCHRSWGGETNFESLQDIPSSYIIILMLHCLENTLKLKFDSYVTAVKFLIELIFRTTWLDLIPTLLESVQILGWNTHRYAKNSPFTWL